MKRTCKCKARLEKDRDWCENCGRWYPAEWVEKYASSGMDVYDLDDDEYSYDGEERNPFEAIWEAE
jgi:hypothetical protein